MGNGSKLINPPYKDLVDAQTIIDSEVLESIKKLNVKEKKFKHAKKEYANDNFFSYYEVYLLRQPYIVVTYNGISYQLPQDCNYSDEAYFMVMNNLIAKLKPNITGSELPRKE